VVYILPFLLTDYSEKFIKKLMGNREIEDSLERLDKLTQEEARMASAEQLKMTHRVDGRVMGVDDRVRGVEGQVQDVRGDVQDVRGDVRDVRGDVQDIRGDVQDVRGDVQDVRGDVQDVGDKVQDVDDKLDQANRSSCLDPDSHSAGSDIFTGSQLRDNLLRWLSPPDPSTNHHIACKAHHNGTTKWFFQGSIFGQWKSTGSFLWVHGKRALLFIFAMRSPLITPYFYSRLRKKRCLVRPSILSTLVRMTLSFQFLDYTRYHGFARCWEGLNGLLLLRFQGR
jgi:uncharacterized protein YoxC